MNKKEIIAKVLKDEPKGFREQFLNDPKGTLEEITGGSLGDWNVEITRVPEKTILFTLPDNIPSSEQISDEMIENVAAGRCHTDVYGPCATPPDDSLIEEEF